MRNARCNSCAHYRQHYAFDNRKIFRVYCGHCTFGRARKRKPDAEICENYVPTEPDEAAFATKEYLTKTLLEYVLGLELLPQIHNMEDTQKKQDNR